MAPPPPLLKVKKGSEVTTPLAMQTHGDFITWQQQHSNLEEKETLLEQQKGRKVVVEDNSDLLLLLLLGGRRANEKELSVRCDSLEQPSRGF